MSRSDHNSFVKAVTENNGNDFSYETTFDELSLALQDRLQAEQITFSVDDKGKATTIKDIKNQLAERAIAPIQLQEDIASFATAFFLKKSDALVVNRLFLVHEIGDDIAFVDDMSDVAEIIRLTDFSTLQPPIITFVYRVGAHLMSVVINGDNGEIRFTNSTAGDYGFKKNVNKKLIPTLNKKFGRDFAIISTPDNERILQSGDGTTCNFHALLNNVIGVLRAKNADIKIIAGEVSKIFGVAIEAENISDLINKCQEHLQNPQQKVDLQKRMVCAAQIYRENVKELYVASPINQNFQTLVRERGKFSAYLSGIAEKLSNGSEEENWLASIFTQINDSIAENMLINNFSLNPDLRLVIDQEGLDNYVLNHNEILQTITNEAAKNAMENVVLTLRSLCTSLGDNPINDQSLDGAVEAIKEMEEFPILINYAKQNSQLPTPVENFTFSHKQLPMLPESLSEWSLGYNESSSSQPSIVLGGDSIYSSFFSEMARKEDLGLSDNFVDEINADYQSTKTTSLTKKEARIDNALRRAIILGDCKVIDKLIKRGVDLNATDNDGGTALHILFDMILADSIYEENEELLYEAATLLINGGADPNKKIRDTGDSPLYLACIYGADEKIIKMMLDKGGNITLASEAWPNVFEGICQTLVDDYIDEVRFLKPLKLIIENHKFEVSKKAISQIGGLYEKATNDECKEFLKQIKTDLEVKLSAAAVNNDIPDAKRQKVDENSVIQDEIKKLRIKDAITRDDFLPLKQLLINQKVVSKDDFKSLCGLKEELQGYLLRNSLALTNRKEFINLLSGIVSLAEQKVKKNELPNSAPSKGEAAISIEKLCGIEVQAERE